MSRPADARPADRATLSWTRRARGWAGVSVAVLFAALNTANNLLYLLFALLVAALVVSAFVARRAVRRVRAEILAPREIRAGATSEAAIRLSCAGAHGGAPGLLVEMDEQVRVVPWLQGGAAPVLLSLPIRLARRGVRTLSLRARCAFPFDLLEARRVLGEAEVLVLPVSLPAGQDPTPTGGGAGATPARLRGPGEELLDIRDWRAGDDARSMDWKATARLERPMVREHERELDRRVALVVDGALRSGPRASAEAFAEAAISRAAGAAETLGREGWRVRLVTPGGETGGTAMDVLRGLARLPLEESALPPRWWRSRLEKGEACLVFSGVDGAGS